MTIFVAGATGAIGKRLIPLLVSAGHRVFATTRSQNRIGGLREQGAEPVVVDGLNRRAVLDAVMSCRPEAIVHQMTAIAPGGSFRNLDREFVLTNRLRTEGTENLLEAARAAGTRIFVAQSYGGWPNIREGSRIKTEEDPLDPNPPKRMRKTLAAIRQLESLVSNVSGMAGIVLRYGIFYGPGTAIADDGDVVHLVRQGKLPVIGSGSGVWSFIHVDDAASATRIAIERPIPGIYNIVDDEPAEVSVWLPQLADAIRAKAPGHLPVWLARLLVGDIGVSVMTAVRGSSNAKAKRVLGWQPKYVSWREGFRNGLSGMVHNAREAVSHPGSSAPHG